MPLASTHSAGSPARPADALFAASQRSRAVKPAPVVPAHLLARLREKLPAATGRVLPFGVAAIDAHLPGGGLPLGQLHEIGAAGLAAETGAITAAFVTVLLARLPGTRPIFWITPCADLYPPGVAGCGGLDAGRLLLAETVGDDETLATMETVLRAGVGLAVVGEVGRFGRTASRRLQLACLRHATTGFVLRRWPHGGQATDRETSVAVTRWRLSAAPSAAEDRDPGPPRWRAELLHVRGGRPGAWLIEMEDEDAPHPVRLVAALADHAADSRRRRAA